MNKIKRSAFDTIVDNETRTMVLCDKCIDRLRASDSVIRLLTYESITIEDSVPCANCKKEVIAY